MLLACAAFLAQTMPAVPAHAGPGTSVRRDDDPAGVGIQLVEIPRDRAEDPRARAYIVDHINPGTTIHRKVKLRNTSSTPQHVELYAGAATVENNAFTINDGRAGNELTSWVSLDTASVDIPSGDSTSVEVSIAVPSKASRGERYGAIWAQVSSPTEGGNIAQIHRVGIRIYLDIGLGGEPPTDFRIDGIAAVRGSGPWPVVAAQVTNTGERAIDMTGTLALSKGGVRAGPYKVTNGATILPGHEGRVEVEVNETLADGTWDATLTLASGTVERKATGRINLPIAAAVVPMSSARPWWLVPFSAAIVLMGLGVLAWYLVRRRSRGGHRMV